MQKSLLFQEKRNHQIVRAGGIRIGRAYARIRLQVDILYHFAELPVLDELLLRLAVRFGGSKPERNVKFSGIDILADD